MFALDLGELAYCRGDAVVLSNEVLTVAPDGEAADLPRSCAPEAYHKHHGSTHKTISMFVKAQSWK